MERRDFYREVAHLLNQPEPTFHEPSPEVAASTRGGDKRICNQRLIQQISPIFQFPSYREGLKAIVAPS